MSPLSCVGVQLCVSMGVGDFHATFTHHQHLGKESRKFFPPSPDTFSVLKVSPIKGRHVLAASWGVSAAPVSQM